MRTKKVENTDLSAFEAMINAAPADPADREAAIQEAKSLNWSKSVDVAAGVEEAKSLVLSHGWKPRADLAAKSQVNRHGDRSTVAVVEAPKGAAKMFVFASGKVSVQNLTREAYAQLLA